MRASDVEVNEVVEPTVAEIPVVMEARVRALVRDFASLDAVNLVDLFDHRARVMRSVPHVLKGVFRVALRVAFHLSTLSTVSAILLKSIHSMHPL